MGTRCLQLFLALLTSIKRVAQTNQSANMMKFTVLMVLLAVAAVHSKKYCGGGYALGGCGGAVVAAAPAVATVAAAPAVAVAAAPVAAVAAAPVAAVAAAPAVAAVAAAPVAAVAAAPAVAVAAAPAVAVAHPVHPAIPFVGTVETYSHSGATHTILGAGATVIGGGCIDALTGCGGYAGLGYCGRAYYATGCCNTCGIYKKKK